VLSGLSARRRPGQTLIGFAAETGEQAVAYGRGKLTAKRLDAVVVNDVAAPGVGFDVETNAVTIVTAGGDHAVALASKAEIAAAVLDAVMALRGAVDGPAAPASASATARAGTSLS
jgi:phosphopantothenoylcysteine decarboxylase/phosphopantothenate--cysteine ligase